MAKKDKKDEKSTDKKSDKKSAKKSDKARAKDNDKQGKANRSHEKAGDKKAPSKLKEEKKGGRNGAGQALSEDSVIRTVETLVEKTIGNVVENAIRNIMKTSRQGLYVPDDDEFFIDPVVGSPGERVEIVLSPGDTIWALSQKKYGEPKIEAVYEANGLIPEVVTVDGRDELRDRTVNAGDKLILPASNELDSLTMNYKRKLSDLREEHRALVGKADESTEIRLVYGDTLHALAVQKYGKSVPPEALFEANNLAPRIKEEQGKRKARIPIYYAGKKYRLPAESEIEALTWRYRERHGIEGFEA